MVTDTIRRFVANGIELDSGDVLEADVVVKATGLELLFLGHVDVSVDGRGIDTSKALIYRGMMVSDLPNLAFTMGYTNASWTLKADLTNHFVCRLLNYMRRHGYSSCVPHNSDPGIAEEPYMDFSSGYVQRALDRLPKQGSRAPWRLHHNYVADIVALRLKPIADAALIFS